MSESNLSTPQNLQDLVIKVDNQVYRKLAELADRSGHTQPDLVTKALHLLFAQFDQGKVDEQDEQLANLKPNLQSNSQPNLNPTSNPELQTSQTVGDRPIPADPTSPHDLNNLNTILDQHSQQISQLQAEISQLQQRLSGLEHNSPPSPAAIDSPLLNPLTGKVNHEPENHDLESSNLTQVAVNSATNPVPSADRNRNPSHITAGCEIEEHNIRWC